MSITALSNKWLNKLYKSIAILLVMLAVFISALRLFLPYAPHYKDDLKNYLNTTYGTNIEIGSLSMGWQKLGPVLVANNVSLLETESVAVFIQSMDIKLNFWRTLQHRTLVTSDLTLNGAKVFIDRAELASNASSSRDLDLYEQLSDVFLLHVNKFSLSDSQLVVRTDIGERKLFVDHLNWLNKGERHRASGNIIAHGLSTNSVKVLVDMHGTEFDDMTGQIYLQAQKVNLTPWLDQVLVLEDEKTYSEVNLASWLTVERGKATHFQAQVEESKLRWIIDENEHQFLIKSGAFSADILPHGIKVRSSPIALSVDQNDWQPVYVNMDIAGEVIDLYVSQLDIEGLSTLAPLIVESPDAAQTLAELDPQGQVSDFHVQLNGDELMLAAKLVDYRQAYSTGMPGLANLSADVVLKNNQFVADIAMQDTALYFGKHFLQPIPLDEFSARLTLSLDEQRIKLNGQNILFSSPSLALNAELNIEVPSGGDAKMALLANIERGDAKNADLFYPHLLMGEDLVSYLNNSIFSGEMASGQVLFNGAFSDFPFHDNQGVFVVDAELENAQFQFDPQWPVIENLAANLNFTNNGMLITARNGDLTGLNVSGVTAAIDDLTDEQLLVVKANIDRASPANVKRLMQLSPLADSVGATLETLQVAKPVSGSFQLDLPLNDTDNVVAAGHIDFKDNDVNLATPEMEFSQVNGRLTYRNDVITAKQLQLMWRGMPVTVNVDASDKADYYNTKLTVQGDWHAQQWLAQLPENLTKYGSGELNWQGDIELHAHHDGDFSYQALVSSNLSSAALSLPAPYKLDVGETLALSAKVEGQSDQSTITVNGGEQLSFFGVLNHQDVQFKRAHIVLGNDTMLLPMDGFHITTKLASADIHQWQPLIQDILANLPGDDQQTSSHSLFPAPERIRGNIEQLNVLDHQLTNVSFNLLDKKDWWLLRFNAKEARSEIKFYPNWLAQGLEVDADFIHINTTANGEQTVSLNVLEQPLTNNEPVTTNAPLSYQESLSIFNSIPRIVLTCDSCKVNELNLGELSFSLRREQDAILLENFKAKRSKANANFNASWQLTPERSTTQIKGQLNVKDLEQELEQLGFASAIKDSGMTADYDINWQGGPQEFTLGALNGNIKLDIDDGYLADVSDKGARIFSVLSLQSLVRKLTLDFRDIFADGMFYDYIRADAQIEDGVLYTNNTRMKGGAGDLSVKGNTNLAAGTLDYRMSYKPNLTSSLPVLAWIATLNPYTFLAGVAIDEVFTSKVVSEFNFELTGNVTDPQLKEVNRKSRDVSVGRSTPPKFVENKNETAPSADKGKNLTPPLPIEKIDKNDG